MSRAVDWLRDEAEEWRTAVVVTVSRSLALGRAQRCGWRPEAAEGQAVDAARGQQDRHPGVGAWPLRSSRERIG